MKKCKRLLSVFLSLVMAASLILPLTSFAEDGVAPVYEATNSYALNFGDEQYGEHAFGHANPYRPWLISPYGPSGGYWERTGTYLLYNVNNPSQYIYTYCVDEYTSIRDNFNYKRVNLEDSKYYDETAAGKLRSIMLKGFPTVSYSELGAAAGVEDLTIGEAMHATQLAIWQISYGDILTVDDFLWDIEGAWWRTNKNSFGSVMHDDECYTEISNGYASVANEALIEAHTKAVFDYLINLAPTAPNAKTVSESSFTSWESPVVTDNSDGTSNVSVDVTVNVVENSGDNLKLSAVLGEYFTTVDLSNGTNNLTLTIENVPANVANGSVKLAIDGTQTVSDVYMYTVDGLRETAQSLIGESNLTLPVHAEVMAEPERIIDFYKTTKVQTGTDADGDPTYTYTPLEGIAFDLYYVADWHDYLNGKVTLPAQENIDLSELGTYPMFTAVTDSSGTATVNLTKEGLPDGVYVVAEREHPAITSPVAPFYILLPYTNDDGTGWEYELDIQPKNDVVTGPEIEKDVIRVGNEEATVDAYTNHTWIIGADIPVDIADAKEYTISDTLDNRLDYIGNLVVKVEAAQVNTPDSEQTETEEPAAETDDSVILIENTDYTLTVTDNDSLAEGKPSDSFIVSLTQAGMDKVAAAVGDNYTAYKVRVYFDAQINANAEMGVDIPNQANLKYTNSVNYTFNVESDIPIVYTCGISLFKYDAKNAEVPLAGAKFKVAKVVAEDTEGAETLVVNASGDTQTVIYVDFYATADLSGDAVFELTTGADGIGYVYGLEKGIYYLIETAAPAGYNMLTLPVRAELTETSHLIVSDNDATTGEAVGSAGPQLQIANQSGYELPSTGGIGTLAYTATGSLLCLVSGGMLLSKKRKNK